MPTSIDNSWGKFMLIEVIKTSDDMMMGSAKVLITLWANQIGAGLEDAKTLEAMETTLLQLLKDHCITNDYSLYFSGGGYDVADYEKTKDVLKVCSDKIFGAVPELAKKE